jgi:hypothetical protein
MRYVSDLIDALKDEQVKIEKSLAEGRAPTFDSYQRLVGTYQGLQSALNIINDLLKEPDEDE